MREPMPEGPSSQASEHESSKFTPEEPSPKTNSSHASPRLGDEVTRDITREVQNHIARCGVPKEDKDTGFNSVQVTEYSTNKLLFTFSAKFFLERRYKAWLDMEPRSIQLSEYGEKVLGSVPDVQWELWVEGDNLTFKYTGRTPLTGIQLKLNAFQAEGLCRWVNMSTDCLNLVPEWHLREVVKPTRSVPLRQQYYSVSKCKLIKWGIYFFNIIWYQALKHEDELHEIPGGVQFIRLMQLRYLFPKEIVKLRDWKEDPTVEELAILLQKRLQDQGLQDKFPEIKELVRAVRSYEPKIPA